MSRINTNVNSLIAQQSLQQNQNNLSTTLQRLSTGLQINSGKDNPAGLIASENLKSQQAAQQAALGNAQRADQMANVADGSLGQINSALLQLQSLVTQSANDAGLSSSEKAANQQQIDSILQSVDRIASTTTFQGTKLLNGGLDFTVSGQSAKVDSVQVQGAKLGNQNLQVQATITQSAQHGALFLSLGGTSLNLSTTNPSFVFDVAGTQGSREFSFSSGTATSAMAAQINSFKDTTGVSAVVSGTGLNLRSTGFGSSQFVSLDVVKAGDQTGGVYTMSAGSESMANSSNGVALSAASTAIKDSGQNVAGTVNGIAAVGSGTTLNVNSDALQATFKLTNAGAQATGNINLFTITGGGAKFSLGATVDTNNTVQLGIGSVAARDLGATTVANLDPATKSRFSTITATLADLASGKALNVQNGDVASAQKVVNAAISQVSELRGRIGSFQKNIVGTAMNTLNVAYENTSAAQSQIADTNFASATANMTRNQILVQAATQSLKLANQQPQQVLSLLA